MFSFTRYIFSVLLVGFMLASPAYAGKSTAELPPLHPFNMTGLYKVTWGGIGVGWLVIDANEDGDTYSGGTYIKSTGIAKALTKHESVSTVKGIKKEEDYLPQQFETTFKLRGRTRHIVLDYDENGKLIKEANTPPENRAKRAAVPELLKANEMDVLSMLFAKRPAIYDAIQEKKKRFTLRSYDGRRLMDAHFDVLGRKTVMWNRKPTKVIQFALSQTPIAGYKKSELEDLKSDEPNVHFYLSDDGKLTPLKISVRTAAGSFYANYKFDCGTPENCLRGR